MFTQYGKTIANDKEALRAHIGDRTGATAHAHALSLDTGLDMLITGKNAPTRAYRSVAAAYFAIQAMHAYTSIWHVKIDGTRKLVYRR